MMMINSDSGGQALTVFTLLHCWGWDRVLTRNRWLSLHSPTNINSGENKINIKLSIQFFFLSLFFLESSILFYKLLALQSIVNWNMYNIHKAPLQMVK